MDPLPRARRMRCCPVSGKTASLKYEISGTYDLYAVAPMVSDPLPPGVAPPGPTTITLTDGTIAGLIGAASIRRQPTSRTPINASSDLTDLRIVVSAGARLEGEV